VESLRACGRACGRCGRRGVWGGWANAAELREGERALARLEGYNRAVRLKQAMLADARWRARVLADLGGVRACQRWARGWARYRAGERGEAEARARGEGREGGAKTARMDRGRRFRLMAIPRPELEGPRLRPSRRGGAASQNAGAEKGSRARVGAAQRGETILFRTIPVLPSELMDGAPECDEGPGTAVPPGSLSSEIKHRGGCAPPPAHPPAPSSPHGRGPP